MDIKVFKVERNKIFAGCWKYLTQNHFFNWYIFFHGSTLTSCTDCTGVSKLFFGSPAQLVHPNFQPRHMIVLQVLSLFYLFIWLIFHNLKIWFIMPTEICLCVSGKTGPQSPQEKALPLLSNSDCVFVQLPAHGRRCAHHNISQRHFMFKHLKL